MNTPMPRQLNIRLSDDPKTVLLEELATKEGTPAPALARAILMSVVRDRLGPRTVEDIDVAVLDQISRFQQLHGAAMPIENLVWWLDTLRLPAASFKFNAAIARLVAEGCVRRHVTSTGTAYSAVDPTDIELRSRLLAALDKKKPYRVVEHLNDFSTRDFGLGLANRMQQILADLAAEGLAVGSQVGGFTVTPDGEKYRKVK